MREGVPSRTARGVAAARLGFERVETPYGDPGADEALARDVASGRTGERAAAMERYLRARTAFFDRVVVNAIDRGVSQFVALGAGYDGRALRYAKPDVTWWEVDHPATQEDKRERLGRLGIEPARVRFVPRDLEMPGLAAALLETGFEPDAPTLFSCEGVVVYLQADSVAAMLAELRSLATPGTRLALSLPVPSDDPDVVALRARRGEAMAAIGEPMPSQAALGDPDELLAASRWRRVDTSERSQRAGLAVAVPFWAPPGPTEAPSAGAVARFVERTLWRAGTEDLGHHLETAHGVGVRRLRELDLGVHRVDLVAGSSWIARVSPPSRDPGSVRSDAELLGWLREADFPAERPACDDAASEHRGQGVLVTEFAPGRPVGGDPAMAARLGRLLGRLAATPAGCPAARRPGGAWHHLVPEGTPADELPAARSLLHEARHRVTRLDRERYDRLAEELAALEDCRGLPQALVHPDFVGRNVLGSGGQLTVIDWSGAGLGPRVVALGCLLWSLGRRRGAVAAAMEAYLDEVGLEAAELDALEGAMAIRPLVLAAWMFATGRHTLAGACDWWEGHRRVIGPAARAARAAAEGR